MPAGHEENRHARLGGLPRVYRLRRCGACQRSCRLCYAAEADIFSVGAAVTTESPSGLSVTTAMGCQLRVWRAQRLGLASRARVYS